MTIYVMSDSPGVRFAAEELARYLTRVTGEAATVETSAKDGNQGLRVGTFDTLPAGILGAPAVPNAGLDDAIYIRTDGSSGDIAGSNPVSALIACYRYLYALGCRWVRPGEDGEVIPNVRLTETQITVSESASYRHRGICIEGAVSFEHVRDVIDWCPKVGYNTYFTQFREAFTFFDRWYRHMGNPLKEPGSFSIDRARELKTKLGDEIARRGMQFHDVGHGWTCEPFGIPGLGWDKEPEPSDEVRSYLAEVGGERKLWHGVPLNTNLCYSNPDVRRAMIDDIVAYAAAHPEVDVLHLWLADGSNNHCECAECARAIPSDWYVILLNELDERLTATGVNTRIVFLIYVDLLWPPQKEAIRNPDRFILMFAPITRTYSSEFAPMADLPRLPPYQRNKLEFPRSVEANVAFLKAWQQSFEGDSFDFDYHYMWDHYKDPGYFAIARTLHGDIGRLRDLGLNGLVSCQVQRAFFPTGFGMTAMGQTLWNRDLQFEDLAQDYFTSAFGPDGDMCRQYLEQLSQLFDPPYIRGEKDQLDPSAAERFLGIEQVIEDFRPVIMRNIHSAHSLCHQRSWHYLNEHADICVLLAAAFAHKARGEQAAAAQRWEEVRLIAQQREDDLHRVLDVFEFTLVMGRLFPPPEPAPAT